MPAFPTLSEPLSDGVVLLRDLAERDIPEILIAYQDDPSLHLRTGAERPPSGAELGRLTETEAAERADGARATLTVLEPGGDLCRGQLTVQDPDWFHGHAELALWLVPQARGRGLGRRALRLAARWLCRDCGLARVEIRADSANAAMLAAARAAGFTEEAVLQAYFRRGRGRTDAVLLSLLAAELDLSEAGP